MIKQLVAAGILACVTLAACAEPILTPPPGIPPIVTKPSGGPKLTEEQMRQLDLMVKCGDSYTAIVTIEQSVGPNPSPRWPSDDTVVTRIKILEGRNPLGCQAT